MKKIMAGILVCIMMVNTSKAAQEVTISFDKPFAQTPYGSLIMQIMKTRGALQENGKLCDQSELMMLQDIIAGQLAYLNLSLKKVDLTKINPEEIQYLQKLFGCLNNELHQVFDEKKLGSKPYIYELTNSIPFLQ